MPSSAEIAGRGIQPAGRETYSNGVRNRIAKRLDLTPDEGSRAGQDGALIRWRMAGVQQAAAEPLLPFFIEWGQDTRLPWRAQVSHPAGAVSI
jgi:hypothetical protein